MDAEKTMIPELTLAPQTDETPVLTLDAEIVTPATPAPVVVEPPKPAAEPVKLDDSMLSETEKKAVEEFARKIDVMDSSMILQYGAAAQKHVAGFSENALASVRT